MATQGLGNHLLGDLAPALGLGSYDQVTQKFNEVDELVSTAAASPLGASATYRYDAMGQRLARSSKTAGLSTGTTSYLWDQAGRLLNVDDSATNVSSSYTYDDTNLRATQSKLQLLPNAWDRSGDLPLQLSDGKALYVHGADGLPLLSYKAGLIASVYHHDAQGSTRAITSTDGTPLARYSYDAYGALSGNVKVAAATNPFLYRGQYTDATTGLQYLRARYYDPTTGQFLSRDPIEEVTGAAYAYAAGDPINRVDPTGLFDILGIGGFVKDNLRPVASGLAGVATVAACASGVGCPFALAANTAFQSALVLTDKGQSPSQKAAGVLLNVALGGGGVVTYQAGRGLVKGAGSGLLGAAPPWLSRGQNVFDSALALGLVTAQTLNSLRAPVC